MTDNFPLPLGLRLKHRVGTSPLAAPANWLRHTAARLKGAGHPELGLLRQEDAMIDAVLTRLVKPDWHCLDVGGHLGSISYRLQQLAPRGHLTIVEASPGKAAQLARRFVGATVHAVAVSDAPGEVSFYENLAQPGFSSLADRSDRGATREIRVPARRIDDLMGEARVDFLKIDVEGFEYPALRGAEALLSRERPVILFEAGALGDASIDAGLADQLFDYLTAGHGYRIHAAFDLYYDRPAISPELFASYRRYPYLAFNYFALPQGGNGADL